MPTIFLPILAALATDDNPQLRNRVLAEYPAAIAALEQQYGRVRGSGTATFEFHAGTPDHEVWNTKVSFACAGALKKYHTFSSKAPVEDIRAANDRYVFKLIRQAEGSPLLVQHFEPTGQTSDEWWDIGPWDMRETLSAPYSVADGPMSEIMSHPGFRLKGVSEIERGGRQFLKLDVETGKDRVGPASIVVSPDDGWLIHEWRLVIGTRGRVVSGHVGYGAVSDGAPVLRHVTSVDAPAFLETTQFRRSFDFDEFQFTSVPAVEFTLSHYGLPEMGQPGTDYDSHAAYWFVAIGCALIAIAIALKYFASRLHRA